MALVAGPCDAAGDVAGPTAVAETIRAAHVGGADRGVGPGGLAGVGLGLGLRAAVGVPIQSAVQIVEVMHRELLGIAFKAPPLRGGGRLDGTAGQAREFLLDPVGKQVGVKGRLIGVVAGGDARAGGEEDVIPAGDELAGAGGIVDQGSGLVGSGHGDWELGRWWD